MGSDSAILKSWRDHLPPCSSSLVKVSQLTNNKHESPHFSSGGFNWRLVVYPKGNEEDNGNGFVSMYVECLSSTPPAPMDVFAYLSFFVFNKKDNKYLSIQGSLISIFNKTLTLYPKGDSSEDGELSTFLHLADGEILLKGELIFVRVQVQVLDPRGSNHLKCYLNSWVMASNKAHGMPQSLGKIAEAYLDLEDTLNVEIECEVVNAIKNHPFF